MKKTISIKFQYQIDTDTSNGREFMEQMSAHNALEEFKEDIDEEGIELTAFEFEEVL